MVASPGSIELGEEALDPESIVSGSPRTFEGEIAAAPLGDGSTLATGIWRCTPGTVTDVEADETFVVLSGRATIDHDGASHEVGPGDVCVLPCRSRDDLDRARDPDEGLRDRRPRLTRRSLSGSAASGRK